jgi:AAA domain
VTGAEFLRDVTDVPITAEAFPVGGVESDEHRRIIRADVIEPERVEFIDDDKRFPIGTVTLGVGFPGVGKSTALIDLVARVSRQGKKVLIATREDHLAAVVRPRLEAARAALENVYIVTIDLTFPEQLHELEEIVGEAGADLVIVDPVVAFLSEAVNSHRDHHVRRVLGPMSELAERCRIALVLVVHTNKGQESEPLLRVGGSIGFSGAARSVILFAQDPNDDDRRIMATVKSNLAAFAPPLAYRIVPVTLQGNIETSRLEWLGEAPEIDVGGLLARQNPQDRSVVDDAIDFLQGRGILETPQQAHVLFTEAAELGIDKKALQRARRRLGTGAWPDGFGGPWMWGPKPEPQSGHPHPVHSVHTGDDQGKRPAEDPQNASLDSLDGAGEEDHSRCLRCARYGPDHIGAHVSMWPGGAA